MHVCVSNYCWNLLQALARAATERSMACRIKAIVVRKRSGGEKDRASKRRDRKGTNSVC